MTLTLGLTGFTAANWSQALSFDLLLPRKTQTTSEPLDAGARPPARALVGRRRRARRRRPACTWPALIEALQLGCQQGQLMYDLADDVYRFRPLTDAPLDLARLEYRNRRERIAHDLLARRGAVKIVVGEPHRRHRPGADRPGDGGRGPARVPAADAPGRRGAGDAGPTAPAPPSASRG